MKRFALLLVSGAYVSGVGLGSLLTWTQAKIGALLLAATVIGVSMVLPPRFVWRSYLLLVCALGGLLLSAFRVEHFRTLADQKGVEGSGLIRGEASVGVFDARINVVLDDCGTRPCPQEGIQVRVDRFENVSDGMRVRLGPCDLSRPERFDPAFDYPLYLAKEGVGFVARDCPLQVVDTNDHFVRAGLHDSRVWLATRLGQIPEPEAGLARGLLLGGSDELPESVVTAFRIDGLSHIVAVSGYNISVLAGAFFLLGIALGWYRKQAVWIALLGTVLFVLLVGAPASAVRAAGVAVAGFAALLVSRPVQSVSLLSGVAAGMLVWNPLLLRYDIGFQLSFLSTLAIVLSASWRSRFQARFWVVESIQQTLALTAAVLLFVTPLSLFYFGSLSPYAFLANVLVLPLVPIAFFLSFLVVVAGTLPGIGVLFGWGAYGSLHAIVWLAESLAHLPYATASFLGVQPWMLLIWYPAWIYIFTRHPSASTQASPRPAFALTMGS